MKTSDTRCEAGTATTQVVLVAQLLVAESSAILCLCRLTTSLMQHGRNNGKKLLAVCIRAHPCFLAHVNLLCACHAHLTLAKAIIQL